MYLHFAEVRHASTHRLNCTSRAFYYPDWNHGSLVGALLQWVSKGRFPPITVDTLTPMVANRVRMRSDASPARHGVGYSLIRLLLLWEMHTTDALRITCFASGGSRPVGCQQPCSGQRIDPVPRIRHFRPQSLSGEQTIFSYGDQDAHFILPQHFVNPFCRDIAELEQISLLVAKWDSVVLHHSPVFRF